MDNVKRDEADLNSEVYLYFFSYFKNDWEGFEVVSTMSERKYLFLQDGFHDETFRCAGGNDMMLWGLPIFVLGATLTHL